MHSDSKKISLLILAITALACSRAMFAFFHDPEGPNLLVVIGTAAVIYFLTLIVYLSNFSPSLIGLKRTLVTIIVQMFVIPGFYLLLR